MLAGDMECGAIWRNTCVYTSKNRIKCSKLMCERRKAIIVSKNRLRDSVPEASLEIRRVRRVGGTREKNKGQCVSRGFINCTQTTQ